MRLTAHGGCHLFFGKMFLMRMVGVAFFLLMVGCVQKTPVNTVSVESSGLSAGEAPVVDLTNAWPAWRGPGNQGKAKSEDAPLRWSDSENVRWRTESPGRGHGSPIVVGDLVFMATAEDALEKQTVLAYHNKDGSLAWSRVIHEGGFPSKDEIHRKGTNANGTLASDGERVYAVFFNSGKIHATALDLEGKEVWRREVGAFRSKFGYAPSPILYRSFVIVAADNWGGGYIAALDGATGKIAWRIARPAVATFSSPVVAKVGEKDQLLISGCDQVASYDPATGTQNWSTPCIAEATCGTIVTSGDRIYASGGYPDRETVCLDAKGKRIWSNDTKVYEPSLLAVGDLLFAVTDGGIAYCWDARSGNLHWRERLGGSFSASPVLCGERIYVSDLSGKTYVFAPTASGYESLAINTLGEDCYASPAVAGGKIYLRIGVG